MKNILKRVMFFCLVSLFGWQYGASAFHDYDKKGSLSCSAYCSQYGEQEAYSAGIGSIYSYDAGLFKSCQCFTAAEINVIKNCSTTKCPGSNVSGYKQAYIASPTSTYWCTNSTYTTSNCNCNSGYYKNGFSSTSGITCTICPCGSKCVSGTKTTCSSGTYSASGATTCITCPSGSYCTSGACSPTKCPDNPPATSNSGATSIRSCYYPKDIEITDATGTYLFTSNCFYSA